MNIPEGANASKSAPDNTILRFEVFDAEGQPMTNDQLPMQRAAHGEEVADCEFEWRFEDGERRSCFGNATPLRDANGNTIGAVAAFIDITTRKLAENALRESQERLAAALRAGKLGVYDYDLRTGRVRLDYGTSRFWGILESEEVPYETFESRVHPDDLNHVRAAIQRALDPAGTRRFECEYRVVSRSNGSIRWIVADGVTTFEAEAPVRLVGIVRNVTERKRAQEHVHLLMREVNHRSKNMLTIVQAIARQTIASTPEDFLERFGDRVEALAASQDLLVKNAWKGVELACLIRSQLALFEDLIGSRIELGGPPLLISASAAQTLGMALHELATNAGKYGALSNSQGRVRVEWRLEPGSEETQPAFHMQWLESGGPAVTEPERLGFGSIIISETPETNLDAIIHLDFAATGLVWRLECPAQQVAEDSLPVTRFGSAYQAPANWRGLSWPRRGQ